MPEQGLLEIRHLEDRCKVEKLTAVAQAITPASISVAKIWIGNGRIRPGIARLIALERSDTVPPGVVAREGHAFARALAYFQQHAVIAGLAATLDLDQITHVLSGVL